MLANVREVLFPVKGDERGCLVVQESCSDLMPFEVLSTLKAIMYATTLILKEYPNKMV